MNDYEEMAWDILKEFNKITPALISRKLKIDLLYATNLCYKIWLRQHLEGRSLAEQLLM